MTRQKLDMDGYGSSSWSGRSKILIAAALIVILALVIAVAVLASRSNDTSGTGSQKSGDSIRAPDCSLHSASSNLDIAKCVLESYPLIDG